MRWCPLLWLLAVTLFPPGLPAVQKPTLEVCAQPLQVHIWLPDPGLLPYYYDLPLCGQRSTEQRPAQVPTEELRQTYPILWEAYERDPFAVGMHVRLERSDAGARLEITLGDAHSLRQDLTADGPAQAVRWRDLGVRDPAQKRDRFPPLRVRLERLRPGVQGLPYLRIQAVKRPAAEVADSIATAAGLKITGAGPLCRTPVTFNFEVVPAFEALQLIGDVCELHVQPVSRRSVRLQLSTDWHKIQRLQAQLEQARDREPILRQLVELAPANHRRDIAILPSEWLQELADAAAARGEFAQARAHLETLVRLSADWHGRRHLESELALARMEDRAGAPEAARERVEAVLSELLLQDPDGLGEDWFNALLLVGRLLLAQENWTEARQALATALSVNDHVPWTEVNGLDPYHQHRTDIRALLDGIPER